MHYLLPSVTEKAVKIQRHIQKSHNSYIIYVCVYIYIYI